MWRRVLVTAIVALWCGFEWFVSRDPLWSWLVTGLFAYAIYTFFIAFPKEDQTDDTTKPQG
jgi:hypothetical protein